MVQSPSNDSRLNHKALLQSGQFVIGTPDDVADQGIFAVKRFGWLDTSSIITKPEEFTVGSIAILLRMKETYSSRGSEG